MNEQNKEAAAGTTALENRSVRGKYAMNPKDFQSMLDSSETIDLRIGPAKPESIRPCTSSMEYDSGEH